MIRPSAMTGEVVAGFALRWVAGLRFDPAPGGVAAQVDPGVGLPLDRCALTRRTPQGSWRLAWERRGDGVAVELEVPPGGRATVAGWSGKEVLEGGTHAFELRGGSRTSTS